MILQDVAGNLKSEKFKDYQVTVEGHTDDAPINTSLFPSNWGAVDCARRRGGAFLSR